MCWMRAGMFCGGTVSNQLPNCTTTTPPYPVITYQWHWLRLFYLFYFIFTIKKSYTIKQKKKKSRMYDLWDVLSYKFYFSKIIHEIFVIELSTLLTTINEFYLSVVKIK